MSKERMERWLTVGANLAVLAGLIFVAMELRESRNASNTQAADAIADGFLQLNLAMVSDSTVSRTWVVGLRDPEALSDVQAIQFSMHLRGLFNQFQRIHRLYRTGLLPEADWSLFAREASWIMSTPGGQLHFARNQLGSDFRADIARYEGEEPNIDLRLGRQNWPLQ